MPLEDVEPGTKTVEEKIDEILEDTSTTLEDKLDAIKLIIDAILIDTNTTLEDKLDVIKPIVDAILEDTSVTLEDKMDALNTLLTTTEAEIDAIEAKLDNATYGLDALRILLDALEVKLDDATYGLSALQKLIYAIEYKLDNVNWGLYAISAAIAAVETKLDSDTYGLSALKTLIDAIEGKLDVPANFMADISALALEATLSTHDTEVKAEINANEAKIDTVDGNVDTLITRVPAEVTQRAKSLFVVKEKFFAPSTRITVSSSAANKAIRSGVDYFTLSLIPSGVTIDYVHFLVFAQVVENTNAAENKVDGLQYIQVQKTVGGTWTNCAAILDDALRVPATTRDMGRLLGAPTNCMSEVDANGTYNLQWTSAQVDVDSMNLDDMFFIVEIGFH